MYDQDTFFQLSIAGQTGLAVLSSWLAVVMIYLTLTPLTNFLRPGLTLGLAVRLVFTMALFWIFVWISPQIYYFYYQIIFDNLPWQNIISTPPSAREIMQLLFFQGTNSLAHHSKAVLGWTLIIIAIIKTFRPDHKVLK